MLACIEQAFPFGFGAKRDRGRGFSVTLVLRSLLLNRTETLATQAKKGQT